MAATAALSVTSTVRAIARPAGGLDGGDRLLVGVGHDIGGHDRRALLGEAQRRGAADAPGGAGDDGDLVLETHGAETSW